MRKLKDCPECKVSLDKINLCHSELSWKDFKNVTLNSDYLVTGCSECGEFFLSKGDSKKIDELLEGSIREMTSQFVGRIKKTCKEPQKVIAKRIGLTEVYLSELISKKKTPSYHIFNYLKVLANHGEVLKDLDSFEGRTKTTLNDLKKLSKKFKYLKDNEIPKYAEQYQFENTLTGAA